MFKIVNNIFQYHELLFTLAWKEIAVRYKQAYLGIALAILKPVLLMLIFTIIRGFVGIDSGNVPYPILTFAALLPWTFFQEAASQSVTSVVSNAALVRKIYFPREIFPLAAVLTKFIELGVNFVILAGLMVWYQMVPSIYTIWIVVIIAYTILVSLCIGFIGAAMNVYYRDIATMLPVALNLLMYTSPVIYPLSLVQKKLLVEQAAGPWSDVIYRIYIINPLAGIIDSFQRVLLKGLPPDFSTLWPGFFVILFMLPVSYKVFKKAESFFADVI
ncbi:ABC transporter permease [Desulfobacter postgatei]|jgi:lipopolysaccharide transport system permease protein|uniref:ABC transporter permease n=1 Tax=Desulfobacter postgatei TaxID=2293 RepID=UPI002A35DFE3|nr:ABC transporter permease [Desulfobacter postgatei]MDX9964232.1 ABC transporter permease [Desulfobacter postgatei]